MPEESYGGGYGKTYAKPKGYYNEYYQYEDKSKVQKRAMVKEVKCPKEYGYQKPAYGNDYSDEDVCFVGVNGYDACVADRGSAVFCLVPERESYDAGKIENE